MCRACVHTGCGLLGVGVGKRKWSDEDRERILSAAFERIATERIGLTKLCEADGMPGVGTVMEWIDSNAGIAERYARAKACQMELMADEIIEIADNGQNDWMEENDPDNPGYKFNGEHSQRSKLRVDTRKWLMAKLAPKKYGDRQTVDMNVTDTLAERLDRARSRSEGKG